VTAADSGGQMEPVKDGEPGFIGASHPQSPAEKGLKRP
jgi:hypothetical protein